MKKFFFLLIFYLIFSIANFASNFTENTDYFILYDRQKSDIKRVDELFNVYCIHCWQWEQLVIPSLKDKLSNEGVLFEQEQMPTTFAYGIECMYVLATAKYLGDQKFQDLKIFLFKKIYEERVQWESTDDFFNDIFSSNILTKNEFEQNINTVGVKEIINNWYSYLPIAQIYGTPTFLINNKYVINLNSVKNINEFLELIDYLLNIS